MRSQTALVLFLGVLAVPCPARAETQVSGEVEMGYQKRDVSTNEAYFEKYGETADGAVVPHVSVDVRTSTSAVHFEGNNIRQNNQSFDLNYNQNYKFKIDASWDQTPRDYSNVAQTLYTESSPGVFRLPDPVQAAVQAAAPTATPTAAQTALLANYWQSAHNADLHTQDNKGSVKMGFVPTEHTKFSLGFSEDNIQGHKPWGGAFSTALLTQLPLPVDYKIYNMNAGSQYNTKDLQLGFNYLMSAFQNQVETLIWDNPRRLADQTPLVPGAGTSSSTPGQGRENLAPDNWSHTVSLNAGVNLPAKTRFTATGSMGYMRQNQELLPFTINSAILTSTAVTGAPHANLASSLPEQSANAKMLTWTQDYALTNRVVKPVTLGLHYHSYQMVNQTSDVTFAGMAPADTAWENDPGSNGHLEFRKDLLEGSFDYQVVQPLVLGVKYGTEWVTRNDRETRDSTENTLTVNTDITPARWTILRGTYVHAHRRPKDFNTEQLIDEVGNPSQRVATELPGLRRYDVSDRLRNQGKVLWQVMPSGPFNMGVHGSLTHDNFQPGIGDLTGGISTLNLSSAAVGSSTAFLLAQQNQMYGLLENRDAAIGVDVGLDVSDSLTFDAYYDYEQNKALQRSNDSNVGIPVGAPNGTAPVTSQDAGTDWLLREVDRYHTAGIAAHINRSTDPLSFKLAYDVVISRGASDFLVNSVRQNPATGNAGIVNIVTPPDTKFMKQDISLRTNIRVSDHWSVILGYLFEKYDVTNWQQQNIPIIVPSGAIYMGLNLQNYVAHVGSVIFKYKF